MRTGDTLKDSPGLEYVIEQVRVQSLHQGDNVELDLQDVTFVSPYCMLIQPGGIPTERTRFASKDKIDTRRKTRSLGTASRLPAKSAEPRGFREVLSYARRFLDRDWRRNSLTRLPPTKPRVKTGRLRLTPTSTSWRTTTS